MINQEERAMKTSTRTSFRPECLSIQSRAKPRLSVGLRASGYGVANSDYIAVCELGSLQSDRPIKPMRGRRSCSGRQVRTASSTPADDVIVTPGSPARTELYNAFLTSSIPSSSKFISEKNNSGNSEISNRMRTLGMLDLTRNSYH